MVGTLNTSKCNATGGSLLGGFGVRVPRHNNCQYVVQEERVSDQKN